MLGIKSHLKLVTGCQNCPSLIETEKGSDCFYCEKTGIFFHDNMFNEDCPLPETINILYPETSGLTMDERNMLTASNTMESLL